MQIRSLPNSVEPSPALSHLRGTRKIPADENSDDRNEQAAREGSLFFFERPYALLSPPSLHIARSSRSAHNKTTHNKIAHNKIAHNKTARRHPPQAVHLISAQVFPLLWHRITLSEYRSEVKLLQFNLSTSFFKFLLDFFSFSFRNAFFNYLRCSVN